MNKFICCARACVEPHSEAMFAYLVIRIFQLIFLIGIMFSFTINQPKQYFSLFFRPAEHSRGLLGAAAVARLRQGSLGA